MKKSLCVLAIAMLVITCGADRLPFGGPPSGTMSQTSGLPPFDAASSGSVTSLPAPTEAPGRPSTDGPSPAAVSAHPFPSPSPSPSPVPPADDPCDLSWLPADGLAVPPGWTGPVAYLTFDDGPGIGRTPLILDELDRLGIKATFFVVGGYMNAAAKTILKDEAARGHTVGNHTWTHFGSYESLSAFEKSVDDNSALIERITGIRPFAFRYPGGSIECGRDFFIRSVAILKARGLTFYDWNTSAGDADASKGYSAVQLRDQVMKYVKDQKLLFVLIHDITLPQGMAGNDVVGAVSLVVRALYEKGYRFSEIRPGTVPVRFRKP